MSSPTISVIVACKNPGPRLHAALGSVWEQRWVQPELIVIDGASSDGSREWLEAQRERIACLISESDTSVYEALNKGVARATGDWVIFLGADDRLVGDMVLSEALNWMKKTEAGIAAGEAAFDDGRLVRLRSRPNPLARDFVPRASAFYRRTLFAENDGFDPSFGALADYEFHVRLWKHRVRFKPLPLRIAACGVHGSVHDRRWRMYREEMRVRHRYFSFGRCLPWDIGSVAGWAFGKLTRPFRRH